jgi:protein-tyrosine-phosphatase
MAEGLLRRYGDKRYEVFSAGTNPSVVNPMAIEVMSERGIDLTGQRSKHWDELIGESFDTVITACDDARDRCPVFPGEAETLHWSLADPGEAEGSSEEKLEAFRQVRDELAKRIRLHLLAEPGPGGAVREREMLIRPTTSRITLGNRWDHFLARWGFKRSRHRVEPGLYALGNPTPDSPVLVTANYTLSFDSLRSALAGFEAYILVLDTQGINVWCAAGKGTFGTDELVHRIETTGLHKIVNHCVIILPQLGAPGVAAHEVKKRAGFTVEYGPVRAADLGEYLKTRKATSEMRRVDFLLGNRLVLIPVELVHVLLPMVIAGIALFFLGGGVMSLGVVSAVLAGVVLFPILLPWLPTPNFSTKGLVLGGAVSLPFVLSAILAHSDWMWWEHWGWALAGMVGLSPVTAFLALNFTGSTPFTSRSGVRSEIFAYIPTMAVMFGTGLATAIVLSLIQTLGGR